MCQSFWDDIRHVCSAIEDLAFTNQPSRASDKGRQRGCIEHDFAKEIMLLTRMGTEDRELKRKFCVRSSAAAEKDDEGMALKILTRAEDIPDGNRRAENSRGI